jgi:hypothetical protein
MGWFGKQKSEVVTHTQTVTLNGPARPVRNDVVDAFDSALGALGTTELLHANDPARIATFKDGGPPVWSVATTQDAGAHYFLTYGFSHTLSPEPGRESVTYEFSLAVPSRCQTDPWAIALLRHLCRYQLTSGNELMSGDVMPCHAPITYIPFPPQHHAMMPPTHLDSIVVVADPRIPRIATAHGTVEVRRIVGCTMADLHQLGPLPPAQRTATFARRDPNMLTAI